MKFIEALRYALSRKVVLPDEYYQAMTDEQRQAAVSIAGLAQLEHIEHIINLVNKSLDNGGTFAEFVKQVKDGEVDISLPRHRLDNIFRTNVQSAYNHGRYQQQQSTKDIRPYLMYDAVNDSRTRPSHLAMDGIIRHIDDSFWNAHYPPNGFRCRCITRALTTEQADKFGGETVAIPELAKPDNGWAVSPKNRAEVLKNLVETYESKNIPTITGHKSLIQAKERVLEQIEQKANGVVFAEFKGLVVAESEVQRLLIDPLDNKPKLAEAVLAAQLQEYFKIRLNRVQPIYDKAGNPLSSADFVNVISNETFDMMFAMYGLSQFKIDKMNEFFAHTDKAWGDKIEDIQNHLNKADIVPLDLRYLNDDNRALIIAYVLSLPIEQQQQIILIMGEKP